MSQCNLLGNPPRWTTDKADWSSFAKECEKTFIPDLCDDDIDIFSDNILNAFSLTATKLIPKSSGNTVTKAPVPWWNDDCSRAIKDRKSAKNRAQHTRLYEDIIVYKKCKAIAQNTIKSAQRNHWRRFCSSLSNKSSIKNVRAKVKCINGKPKRNVIPTLICHNVTHVTNEQKCNVLADSFAYVSSSENY